MDVMDLGCEVARPPPPCTALHLSTVHALLVTAGRNWGAIGEGGVEWWAGGNLTSLTVGDSHACGLTPSRQAVCWGQGADGQLGYATSKPFEPTPLPVSGNHTFAAISAGEAHTCALTPEGDAWCWGRGGVGYKGPGNFPSEPILVPGGLRFSAISAGAYETFAVTTDGEAITWSETSNNMSTVPGNHTFRAVTAGSATCGIDNAGLGWCWGTLALALCEGMLQPLPAHSTNVHPNKNPAQALGRLDHLGMATT